MADELLSINTETLDAIGAAIRGKNGQSGAMTPAQMATAIEALDTYPAATKLPHTDKVLTPTDTSYTVPVGVHDGTETVSIQLESMKTVTPTTSQQEITPTDSIKFLGTVRVNGISSSGYKIKSGTFTTSSPSKSVSVPVDFTPAGGIIVAAQNVGGYDVVAAQSVSSYTFAYYMTTGRPSCSSNGSYSTPYGSFNFDASSYTFDGTYRYFIWWN